VFERDRWQLLLPVHIAARDMAFSGLTAGRQFQYER